jgi:hypothetical protein
MGAQRPKIFLQEWLNAVNGSNRVNRGGGWNNNAVNCRSAKRNNDAPGNRNENVGFRLASTRHCQRRCVYGCSARAKGSVPAFIPRRACWLGQTTSGGGVW